MAGRGSAVRPPDGWRDTWLSQQWLFQQYRTSKLLKGHPDAARLGRERVRWQNGPVAGIIRPDDGIRQAWNEAPRPDLNAPILPARYRHVRDRYIELSDFFAVNQPDITVNKPLGWGGMGLVAKCTYTPGSHPGARTRRRVARAEGTSALTMVMKVDLGSWEDEDLYLEEKSTEKFRRAAHIIQLVDRSKVGMPPTQPFPNRYVYQDDSSEDEDEDEGDESYDDQPDAKTRMHANMTRRQQQAQHVNRFQQKIANHNARRDAQRARLNSRKRKAPRKDFILLEFLQNGDLMTLIRRMVAQNEDCPNRILWGFWLCMVRACVAMEYPPRKFHPGRHLPPPQQPDLGPTGKRINEDLFEAVPGPNRRWAKKRFVHFDIDPKNILIGGLDTSCGDNEHDIIPRLKLADFGIADHVKPNKRNEYYLTRRKAGKWKMFAPEQFGAEWDQIRAPQGALVPSADGPELAEEPIAGNYGAATNVWGIALTMWQLITKVQPVMPPRLQHPSPPDIPNAHYAIDLMTDIQYFNVDRALRVEVANCMAHDPNLRPTPQALLDRARVGVRKQFPQETDAFITNWVQDMIFNA